MNDTTPLPVTPAEPGSTRPRRSVRPVLIGTGAALTVLALGFGGFALADTLADGSDDRLVITSSPTGVPSPSSSAIDDAVSDADYAAVTAAALAAVGGGTVLEVDRGDSVGDAAWKVEIRLANGDTAEVRLDEDLTVIRVELDSNDDDGAEDVGDDNGGDDLGDDHGGDDSGSDDSDDSGSNSGSDDSGSDDSGHGSDD